MNSRFVHVNVVASDWRRLADFYIAVFGCVPVPPERHLGGEWLSRATGLPGAALSGVHLRLPSDHDCGTTLEVFQYTEVSEQPPPSANRQGLGHIAFEVDDVDAAVSAVLAHGGSLVGQVVSRPIQAVGTITFAYARDPEGNILELQSWDRDVNPAVE